MIDLNKYKLNTSAQAPTGVSTTGISLDKYKTATAPTTTQPNQPTQNWGTDFMNEAAKSFITQGANIVDTLSQPVINTAKALGFSGAQNVPKINVPEFNAALDSQFKSSGGLGSQAGQIYAAVTPYIIPGIAASKASATVDAMTRGLPAVLGAVTRIGAKSAIEAGITGGTTLLTTNDPNKAKSSAMWAGALSGVFHTAGEVARAYGIPEMLMRKFFKDNEIDIKKTLSTKWASDLKTSDPTKYADYVTKGLIKESKKGEIVINQSLAKKAMDNGIYGSPEGMGKKIYGNLKAAEDDVQHIVTNSTDDVLIKDAKALHETLLKKSVELQSVGRGEEAAKALDLAARVKPEKLGPKTLSARSAARYNDILGDAVPEKGSVRLDPDSALNLKRFLDGEIKYSKQGVVPESTLQRNLEYWANELRGKVNAINGKNVAGEMVKLGDVMGKYSDNMKMYQSIINFLKGKGNMGLASEMEKMTATHLLASGHPLGALGSLSVGMGRAPRTMTGAARFINAPTSAAGATTRAVIGNTLGQ